MNEIYMNAQIKIIQPNHPLSYSFVSNYVGELEIVTKNVDIGKKYKKQ